MPDNTVLKRNLTLSAVTLYGIGAILGAGIYVLLGKVAAFAGYFTPLSFLVASIIAIFSAFSYAELSARFPRSAGEAVYIDKAFGQQQLTQLIGLMVIFTGIVSAATMATGITGYVQIFLHWPEASIITCFVLSIGILAIWNIDQAIWVVMLITLLEICGLLYVVFIAADSMFLLPIFDKINTPNTDHSIATGIMLGSFLAFYAYIGFEDMVNIAEEIKQPEKVLPKAIILALIISTIIYMAVSYAAISVLTPTQLASSNAPLADVVITTGHSASWVSAMSLIAITNGAIIQLIMASRVIYGMASQQLLPTFFAHINNTTYTPVRATLSCIAATLLLSLLFPIELLAQTTSIIVLSIFLIVNASLIKLNSMSTQQGVIHYPKWIPYIGALLCLAMLSIKGFSAIT